MTQYVMLDVLCLQIYKHSLDTVTCTQWSIKFLTWIVVHNVAHCKKLEIDLTQENSCTVDSFWSRQWITYFCYGLGLYPLQNMNLVTTKIPRSWNSDISVHVLLYELWKYSCMVAEPLGWVPTSCNSGDPSWVKLSYSFSSAVALLQDPRHPKLPEQVHLWTCHKLVIVLATWVKSQLHNGGGR